MSATCFTKKFSQSSLLLSTNHVLLLTPRTPPLIPAHAYLITPAYLPLQCPTTVCNLLTHVPTTTTILTPLPASHFTVHVDILNSTTILLHLLCISCATATFTGLTTTTVTVATHVLIDPTCWLPLPTYLLAIGRTRALGPVPLFNMVAIFRLLLRNKLLYLFLLIRLLDYLYISKRNWRLPPTAHSRHLATLAITFCSFLVASFLDLPFFPPQALVRKLPAILKPLPTLTVVSCVVHVLWVWWAYVGERHR